MQQADPLSGKYLGRVTLVTLLLLTAVAGINRLVDPFALHAGPRIAGFNEKKPFYFTNLRATKAAAVRRMRPTAIVLGSSRAEFAIDPAHPGWRSERVYNLALSGTTIYESWRNLQHAQVVQPLERAVLMLDLLMFNARRKFDDGGNLNPMFDERRLAATADGRPGPIFLGDFLASTLSLDALVKSLKTPLWQDEIVEYNEDGTRVAEYIPIAALGGHRQAFRDNERAKFGTIYNDFTLVSESVDNRDVFRRILRLAHEQAIDLRIAISPAHARMFETIAVRGLWEEFEEWKRDLVRINAEVAELLGREPFPLWDFSGYNSYTTETVPAAGDLRTKMRWYFESSHYTRALGDLLLDRIFEHDEPGREIAADFGVRLDPSTIEAHLEQVRGDREAWRRAFPADAAELQELADTD